MSVTLEAKRYYLSYSCAWRAVNDIEGWVMDSLKSLRELLGIEIENFISRSDKRLYKTLKEPFT